MTKTISLLGSTGSIGRQTLQVARELGLTVAALTANRQVDLLERQAREFHPALAVLYDRDAARELRLRLSDTDIRVAEGPEGLLLAEKSRLQGLEQTVTLPESAEAPVRQGDVLGTLTVTQNGETVLEVPIRAAETVEKLTFGEMFLRLARTMCFCG